MPLNIRVRGAGLAVFIASIVMHILALFSFALRFHRRQQQMNASRRDYSIFYKKKSDLLIVIAVVLSIGHSVAVWIDIRREEDEQYATQSNDQDQAHEHFFLTKYVSDLLYTLINAATKLSIGLFFIELVHGLRSRPVGLTTAVGVTVLWALVFSLALMFRCTPPNKAWHDIMGGKCVNSNALHISQRAVSLLLDLALLLLPAKLMLSVPVGRPTRTHFVLILACGLAVCAVSAYWTIMSPSWMGKLIKANIYRELLWPVIDLYLRVVYANIPFLYALHTAYQPSTGDADSIPQYSGSNLPLERRHSQEERYPLLG